jgi:hypothetical protein
LAVQFPALFSLVQKPNGTVADSFSELGWQLHFRHITSQRAGRELRDLLNRLNVVSLNEEADVRIMRFGPNKHFSVKAFYHYAMNFGGVTCLGNSEISTSLAPKKYKMFSWLALHNRLNTRHRLTRRGIISGASCPFGCQEVKILPHLLFSCPHTSFIWQKFRHTFRMVKVL